MQKFVAEPSVPFKGSFDAEARFKRFPSDYTMKGMFFGHLVRTLGEQGFREVAPSLVHAPRGGRYLPFRDYPQVDYSRMAHATALRRHPYVALAEAARRVARQDFAAFAASTIGRVTLSMIGDAGSALMKFPDMYRMVLTGGSVRAAPLDDATGVRLEYVDFLGWVDCYAIGTIEGLVLHYGRMPTIDVELLGEDHAIYEVRWRGAATDEVGAVNVEPR